MLLRQAARRLGLSKAVTFALKDPRRPASCDHDLVSLVRQRLHALALGYEDLNDHEELRLVVAMQTAVERDQMCASAPTSSRLENRADHETAVRVQEV